MKLIIEIDDEMYKRFAKAPRTTNFNECISDRNVFCKAIKNGIPLEKELKKIRAKIDKLPTMSCNSVGYCYIWAKDYKIDVLSILDESIEENK